MKLFVRCALAIGLTSSLSVFSGAQSSPKAGELAHATRINAPTSPSSPLPRWIKFSGTLTDATGAPRTGTVGVTFAIYTQASGGSSLWLETQNVVLDANGKYSALLGAGSPDGIPADLFNTGEARWLGVQAQFPGEVEQPRILLVSVPYAMKAGDAQTLGGLPASAYALAGSTSATSKANLQTGGGVEINGQINNGGSPSGTINFVPKFDTPTTIKDSQIYDDGSTVGVGMNPLNVTPYYKLQVNGKLQADNIIVSDVLNLFTRTDSVHNCNVPQSRPYTVTGNFGLMVSSGFDGFRGLTDHPCGNGMEGIVTSYVGNTYGVYGQTNSDIGSGVVGEANYDPAHNTGLGTAYGVQGLIDGPKGIGVLGMQNDGGAFPPAAPGDMIGVEGLVSHANSVAGVFDNTAGGPILSGRQNGVENFSVNSNGNVTTSGSVTANSFSGSGAGLTSINAGSLSGTANINITGNAATATNATNATNATTAVNFSGSLSGDVTGTQGATVITSLPGAKITGTVANATNAVNATNATNATSASTAVNFSGSLTGDVTGTQGATVLSNIPTATPAAGTVVHANIAAPATPAAGKVATFSDSTDKRFHDKNDAGTVGTTVVSDAGAANNFLTGITAAGVVTKAQPTFANIGGSLTAGQLSGANLAVTNANNNFSTAQTVTGTMTATTFSGSGASLTNIPGANVTGTVANATNAVNATTATNATNATTAVSFSGALTGDVTGTQGATVLSNIPTATPAAGTVVHANIAAPATPAAGKVATFSDSTDKRFHDKNDAGTIGTTVVANTGSANNFVTGVSAAGVITTAQPTFANIGGSLTAGQLSGANLAVTNANNNFSTAQTVTGTMTATTFSGSGASLTNIPGANVTGTVANATNATTATNATNATTAVNFSGSLTGDVTGTQGATVLSNIPTATPAAGSIVHANVAAPATPAAGKVATFSDSTDKRFHDKNDAGTVGTTVVSDAGAANNFLTGITAAGVVTKAQPTFANIGGSLTAGQLSGANLAVTNANNNFSTAQTVTGIMTATTFSGSGASLTNVPAASITGTLSNAQLANSSVTVNAGTGMSGGGAVALGGSVTLTNAGVTNLAGTANQINASAGTGSVTMSFPAAGVTLPGLTTLTAGNAGNAALNIPFNATGPTSPNAGDIWNVGGVLKFRDNGLTTPLTHTIADNDSAATFTNKVISGASNTITNISGVNVTGTVANASTAVNFSGSLAGDVGGTQGATTLASIVAAGTNTKITYDAKGRVTAGAQAAFSDLSGSVAATQMPALTGDVTMTAGTTTTTLSNIPTATPAAGSIVHSNIAAPATPAAGKVATYSDSTDLRFHDKNAAGTIGTTVVSDTGAANNFLTGVSAAGVITKAQPTFANISGNLTAGQLSGANLAVTNSNNNFSVGQTVTGTVTATTFSGSGASLTNVPAASLTGTVSNGQLANSSVTVSAGTGLSGGGAVSLGGTSTLNLANTAVTPGTYTKLTVDAQGRATSGTSAQFSDIGGTVASSQLPNPAVGAKGGVQAMSCVGNGMIQAINADSTVTCSGAYVLAQSPASTSLTTSDLSIAEIPLAAGVLNYVNSTYDIIIAGGYGNNSNRTMTFSVKLCTVSGCGSGTVVTLTSWTTTTTSSTGTSLPWKIRTSITTLTTGATGTLEPNGDLIIRQSNTASSTIYQDATLAPSASINLAVPLFLEITAHASGTNQTAQVRQIIVEPVN